MWKENSNNKTLGSPSSLALLPLYLLHVKLQFFALQDVSVTKGHALWWDEKLNLKLNKHSFAMSYTNHIWQTKRTTEVTYPSARPHWPGRDEIEASKRPLPNCSSICGSSLRVCCLFSSFLWTCLLFFSSSTAASPSYKSIEKFMDISNLNYQQNIPVA